MNGLQSVWSTQFEAKARRTLSIHLLIRPIQKMYTFDMKNVSIKLETRQLRYFVAVAEELHFGRAAHRLHISQPPLSQQIRQLEEALGVTLFERTQRSVKLTYAGGVFLVQVRSALNKLEDAVDLVRNADKGEAGFLRCGYTAASAYAVIPAVIHAFKQRYPLIEVALRELLSGDQFKDIHEGRLDVGLVRPFGSLPGLVTEKLVEESLMVAIPSEHPLAQQRIIEIQDLQEQPFIGFSKLGSQYFHDMIEALLSEEKVVPIHVQRATQPHAVVALVSAGLGLAIVPDASVRVHMDRVVYRPLHANKLPRPELHLCWRREGLTPLIRNFVASAREVSTRGF